jgi:hypothetical protein
MALLTAELIALHVRLASSPLPRESGLEQVVRP